MALTSERREAIQEEERARWLAREELKRKKSLRLTVIAAVWALSLTALATWFTRLTVPTRDDPKVSAKSRQKPAQSETVEVSGAFHFDSTNRIANPRDTNFPETHLAAPDPS